MAVELSRQNISASDNNKKSIFDSDTRDHTIERYCIFVRDIKPYFISQCLFNEDWANSFTSRLLSWEIQPRSKEPTECFNSSLCITAMRRGDVALLRILMDYKIYVHLSVTIPARIWNSNYEEKLDDYRTSYLCDDYSLDLTSWNGYLTDYFSHTQFEGYIHVHLENYTCISKRRLLHVVCGLEVLRNYFDPVFNDEFNRCYRLIFDFIKEPHITVSEIKDLLRYLLQGKDDAESFVCNVCKQFEDEFPECAGPYRPRSLKHLSRCQIRQNLRNVGKLSQDLKNSVMKDQTSTNVFLPKCLINYILSEEHFSAIEIQRQ